MLAMFYDKSYILFYLIIAFYALQLFFFFLIVYSLSGMLEYSSDITGDGIYLAASKGSNLWHLIEKLHR